MYIKKHKFYDEYWGARIPVYEYDVEEDYDGEVFDIIKNKILSYEIDSMPDTMEVSDGIDTVEIIPEEYLSDEQYDYLEKLLKLVYDYIPIKDKQTSKIEILSALDNIPKGWVEIDWKDLSDDLLNKFMTKIN